MIAYILHSQGTKPEVRGFLPIEIRAMRDSVEDCLRYARDTEEAFKQVHKEGCAR